MLLATLNILGSITVSLSSYGFASSSNSHRAYRKEYEFETDTRLYTVTRIMSLVIHVALGISIAGGVIVDEDKDLNEIQTAINLRHIGAIMFLVQFIFIAVLTV